MSGIARLIEIYKLLIAVRRFLATLFLLSVFSYTKADTEIFYVPKNAIGIIKDHVTHADLSACEGLISNSRETLYKQCYGKAPDGHREQREKLGLDITTEFGSSEIQNTAICGAAI